MGNLVKSRNTIVSMQVDGDWFPIFCAKSAIYNYPQEPIEVTNVNSGASREYVPGMNSGTLNCTGITSLNNDGGKISINYLLQQAIRRTIWPLRMLETDDDGNILITFLRGFVIDTNKSRDVASYSQSSVTFQLTGTPTFSEVIPSPVEPVCEIADPIYEVLAEGQAVIHSDLLVGSGITILWVTREGLGFDETSGSPGNRTFNYNSATGNISFQIEGAPGGELISIGYKVVI